MYSSCAMINNTPYFFILLSVKKIFLSLTFHFFFFFSPSHVLVCLLDSSLPLFLFSFFTSFCLSSLMLLLSFLLFFFLYSPFLFSLFLFFLFSFFTGSFFLLSLSSLFLLLCEFGGSG